VTTGIAIIEFRTEAQAQRFLRAFESGLDESRFDHGCVVAMCVDTRCRVLVGERGLVDAELGGARA
jgi:hypothetical protein